MIGGLYNTTSLLIEPVRALGAFMRAGEGEAAAATRHQAEGGVAAREKGLDAAPVPDRLPTGIVHFIPVVLKMMEARAAEAAAEDKVQKDPDPAEADRARHSDARPAPSAEDATAHDVAQDAEGGSVQETVGHYFTTHAETPPTDTPLDTTI
ncbi:MAG: hypothetical protein AAGG56_16535 [Pseudomonadota bacterium]